ncbi:MAG: hypothetical protein IPK16_30350 [Anaerolineales bacterium]|nr:hypothetical protein [Anaerolineales bacterium]
MAQSFGMLASGQAVAGPLHIHDGNGGFLFVTKTGIVGRGDTLDTVIGGNTLRLALSAGGALTAIRQSGSGTLAIALMFCWM